MAEGGCGAGTAAFRSAACWRRTAAVAEVAKKGRKSSSWLLDGRCDGLE